MKEYFKKNNKLILCQQTKTKQSGFVLLFVVLLSSIILAVTLNVANISYKEISFSTEAKETSSAFFAADTGAECALYYDRLSASIFVSGVTISDMTCAESSISVTETLLNSWSFIVPNLGDSQKGCAKVTISKDIFSDPNTTTITSKGYNNGSGGSSPDWTCTPSANAVERELELNY